MYSGEQLNRCGERLLEKPKFDEIAFATRRSDEGTSSSHEVNNWSDLAKDCKVLQNLERRLIRWSEDVTADVTANLIVNSIVNLTDNLNRSAKSCSPCDVSILFQEQT